MIKGIDRTKQDEDVAEHVIGGVRTDRPDVPRWTPDRASTDDRQQPSHQPNQRPQR